MTNVRHSSQSSCLSKNYMLPGDVNLKIQVIDILFQYFVCFYVRQDAILYSRILYMKTNKQIKQKQFENFR